MSSLIKRSYKVYTAWDYDKEERDLNRKSEEGWQLIRGGCFHSVFKKNENIKYRYKLDFNTGMIVDSIEKKRYIEMFEEQGWNHINTTFNGWSYFCKECKETNSESEYEIYTDLTSYQEMLERWIRIARFLIVFELILTVFYVFLLFTTSQACYVLNIALFAALVLLLKHGINRMREKLEVPNRC